MSTENPNLPGGPLSGIVASAVEYMADAGQRSVLFLDIMRQRGDQYREHVAQTAPHDAVADYYAIPHQLHAEGVRRYGFHGLSYEYIAKSLPQIAPEIAKGRVIVAHLGSGASMCALKQGRSIESTMRFCSA